MKRAAQDVVDELLVMRCQDGDAEALDMLVGRWQKRLWRHAFRLTGREDAAWEVLQEAWLGIVRGIGRLADPACFRRWAYRIVTHKATDWIRRRRRGEGNVAAPVAPVPADADAATDMQTVLASLPPEQRALVSLRYLEELSVIEIAEILDIAAGTVKSRLHDARAALRRAWQRSSG
jgi:RNA polymerase sigma-70 factor (ECF subfamily)